MDEYRLLNKKFKKQSSSPTYRKLILSFLNKVLICVVLFLVGLIVSRNMTYKDYLYKYVYSYNLSFAEIENLYKKYFGNVIPEVGKKQQTAEVFSDTFAYESLEEIEGGVQFKVSKESPISALESGLVIFHGEKEGYGSTLIIEQVDGVEAWYIGIGNIDLEIYDYVSKGSVLGSATDGIVSFYFKKKGETVDYKNYVS